MKPYLVPLVLLLGLGWMSEIRAAPPEGKDSAQQRAADVAPTQSCLRIFKPYSGNLILVVSYPWAVHQGASIETQWLADDKPDPLSLRPLGFVNGFVHGGISLDIERCRDQGERVACTASRSKRDIDFDINAKPNSLSKSAVWVDFHLPTPDLKTETRTAFCLLESWALDQRTLYLDLPPKYYSQPGRLRVWMLRGKDTVWMETIRWPGMQGATDEMDAAAGRRVKPAEGESGAKPGPGQRVGAGAKPEAGKRAAEPAKAAPRAKPSAAKKPNKVAEGAKKPSGDEGSPFDAPEPENGKK